MKLIRIDKNREVEVPESYAEGETMLAAAMNGYHDARGHNLSRQSVAARVAYGLFGERFMAVNPTDALIWLLKEICKRRGAGLDGLGKPRQWRSTEEGYHCVNGHDRCHEMLPGPDCPYCERQGCRPMTRRRKRE
jgi:hypothetical protein